MMFLANENFPRPSILLLRNNGYDVQSIQELHPGVSDEFIIQMAIEKQLVILTFDRDYGELVFRYAQSSPPAIIYFRDKGADPQFAGTLLLKLLTDTSLEFANSFTVIEERNLRQRFYAK